MHFANRVDELARLGGVRPRGGRAPTLMVITGASGVGKSALALRWLDGELERFPHGALYAVLTESTGQPVAAEDVLGQFLRALGVPPERVPVTLTERVTLFRSVTAGRSIAVMLDDAFSAGQVRTLLPASGSSVVVVTSRRPLAGLLPEGAFMMTADPLGPSLRRRPDRAPCRRQPPHRRTSSRRGDSGQVEPIERYLAYLTGIERIVNRKLSAVGGLHTFHARHGSI